MCMPYDALWPVGGHSRTTPGAMVIGGGFPCLPLVRLHDFRFMLLLLDRDNSSFTVLHGRREARTYPKYFMSGFLLVALAAPT